MNRMTLGSKIRSLRKQNGMTQVALADKLGITDKAVSKWERDVSYPDISLFPNLADVLGVTTDDLLKECVDEDRPSRLLQIFEMSHDIRTPLNIILGSAELAEANLKDEKRLLKYLENIHLSGNYLLQMIERLMEVTSADKSPGKLPDLKMLDALEEEEAQVPEVSGNGAKAVEGFDFSGKRILLVDDVAVNREIAAEFLMKTGAEVDFAEDGRVCLDKIARGPAGFYDLILMDIRMPNMDGLEATRMIRRLEDKKKASVPIIAMTANVYEKDRNIAFDAGMDDFTEKPVVIKDLLAAIKRHI